MDVKVSVIMPSLNVAGYIRECMESAVGQTLQGMEIICVDAGSDDGTRGILEEYARKDSRVSVIDSGIKSYGRQVNLGIQAASGKYVAVLETDDFVLDTMYEKLFHAAEQHALDFVMADFKTFYDDPGTGRVYNEARVFGNEPQIYGKVLSIKDHAHIYNECDVTLWRGIFRKEFLVSNHIRLNETQGAAYQDICFMHQVKMKAGRSMYIREYGYCYRTDREGSSVNSARGLRYAKYEYQYLLENEDIPQEYMGKVFYLMSTTLIDESTKLIRGNCLWKQEDEECYNWFCGILAGAVREGKLMESMGTELWWKKLMVLLDSKDDFGLRLKSVSRSSEQIKRAAANTSVMIVCGAGRYGKSLVGSLKDSGAVRKDKHILYADNDSRLWHTYLNGIEILPVNACIKKYPQADFIIASKLNARELKDQLLLEGIPREQIHEYVPVINWD